MAQCRSCTLEIPENSRFCPACGVPASVSGVVRDIAIQTGGAAMDSTRDGGSTRRLDGNLPRPAGEPHPYRGRLVA
jgi:hypothetical protein